MHSKIDYFKLTQNQLNKWGCKYDKLYMGKPDADYYIDDKNYDIFGWFE